MGSPPRSAPSGLGTVAAHVRRWGYGYGILQLNEFVGPWLIEDRDLGDGHAHRRGRANEIELGHIDVRELAGAVVDRNLS